MYSTTYNKNENLWYGPDIPPLYNPNISTAQALLNAMTIFGPKVAQISDNNGICMTFDELRTKTICVAQNLQARGFKPKQTCMLFARNHHYVAPIAIASMAIACPLNSIDPAFGRVELIHMLKTIKPAAVFCDITCYELMNECLVEVGSNADIFTFGGNQGRSEPVDNLFKETHKENEFVPVKVDGPNDCCLIICSSGTTGLPKGVCVSHAAILQGSLRFSVVNSTDILLCFSTLYWISGIWNLVMGTIVGATRIITTEVFSPALYIRLIDQYKVTYTINATHQIALTLKSEHATKSALSSLKYQIICGSKVPFHVKMESSRLLVNGNIIVVYGLSETAGPTSIDYPTSSDKDSIGRLVGGAIVKIIDDNGKRLAVDEDGEICFKMNYQFLGYYRNQAATDEMIDEEGFIKTGDIGHFDKDGDLYTTGRKKEILKYFNFHVSPSEIDAFLTKSPDIQLACVVGIPDSIAPDLPAAVVVRANGSNITEEEIFNLIANHFADHYKLRGGVYFVDSLPITPSGKIQRRLVTEIAIARCNARNT